jgi:hypothetical protein
VAQDVRRQTDRQVQGAEVLIEPRVLAVTGAPVEDLERVVATAQ